MSIAPFNSTASLDISSSYLRKVGDHVLKHMLINLMDCNEIVMT